MPTIRPTGDFAPARWQRFLSETARRHRVPGIIAGALRIDRETGITQRFVASTGVTNTRTGVESTNDTICQIGSITKIMTATMIMQLREEGKLDLGTPLSEILPDLRFHDVDASSITIAHLLTHTSGVDGDVLVDTGRGDDCLRKYATLMRNTRSLFSPGVGWSYCNAGWALAGRVIEVLDGRTWDASLQERISGRLGPSRFLTLPEQIMSHRSQHGHVRHSEEPLWELAPTSSIIRSMGPAGGVSSSADALLDFGAAFLREEAGTPGATLLSADSKRLMTETQVVLDRAADAAAPRWGLGWMLDTWNGHPVYWHLGTTIGNYAWLHVLPDDGLVFVVFCNGGAAELAGPEVFGAFATELAHATPSERTLPSGRALEASFDERWLGGYADFGTSLELLRGERGELLARITSLHESGAVDQLQLSLFPAHSSHQFAGRVDELTPWIRVAFTVVDGRRCAYVDMRCLPALEDAAEPVLPRGSRKSPVSA